MKRIAPFLIISSAIVTITETNVIRGINFVTQCPPQWSKYQNEKCFKIYARGTVDLLNHDQAETACENMGTTLASVTTDEERTFLKSLLLRDTRTEWSETGLMSLWIGFRRKFNNVFWYDLNTNTRLLYTDSRVSLNKLYGTDRGADCAYLVTDYEQTLNATDINFAGIAMDKCSELKGYVCQVFPQQQIKIIN